MLKSDDRVVHSGIGSYVCVFVRRTVMFKTQLLVFLVVVFG